MNRNCSNNFADTIRNPRPINLIMIFFFILCLAVCVSACSCCFLYERKRPTVIVQAAERFKSFAGKNQDDRQELLNV